MTDTKPNAELAYRVLDHIDADPKSWNQTDWYRETDCGTTACFAGWSILLAGGEVRNYVPYATRSIMLDGQEYETFTEAACAALNIRSTIVPGSEVYAGELLVHDDVLFAADNSRAGLDRFVEAIFGPRPAAKA
jgi:hypothetical protein